MCKTKNTAAAPEDRLHLYYKKLTIPNFILPGMASYQFFL